MFSNPGSTTLTFPSLSARRAWIEMVWRLTGYLMMYVALRKESVDRNAVIRPAIDVFLASLSARRAWIEMRCPKPTPQRARVALRKESVDRNVVGCVVALDVLRRSPQGERG